MRLYAATTILAAAVLLAGCSMSMPKMPQLKMPKFKMPRVHRVTVQQGNVITQDMIDSLKPGMTRAQVAFIMGEPVVRNTFDRDRWDYIYTLDIPDILDDEKRISLYFEADKLSYFTGDYVPSDEQPEEAEQAVEGTAPEQTTKDGN